jgi:WD40 repeat protein
MTATRRATVAVLLFLGVWSVAADEPSKPAEPAAVSYYREVRPIFAQHCQGCHQPAKAGGGFVMTSHAALLQKGEKDQPGIVPGKPEESFILDQVTPKNGKAAMPKGKEPLTGREINLIRTWIVQGAKDDTPASARGAVVDMAHPPVYVLPPVITSLAYSPDGQTLAVAGYHEVLLWKPDGSELLGRLVGLSERVQSLAFSPDGQRLAVTGGNPGRFGEVQVWDVTPSPQPSPRGGEGRVRGKLRLSQPVTFDTVYGASWSPDGKLIAFGCADNTLRAIDADTGKQVLYQGAHDDWVLGTVFSLQGTYLVSISRDRSMKLTDVPTNRFIDNITSITPGALKGGLQAVARRPSRYRTIAAGVAALSTMQPQGPPLNLAVGLAAAGTLAAPEHFLSKVPQDTPGAQPKVFDELLTAGADGTPRLYKMHREAKRVIGDDFNKIRDYEALPGRVFTVCFNGDGTLFAAGSSLEGKGEARVYNATDGKRLSTFEGQRGAVYTLDFSPDGSAVASAGFDGMVRINDPLTGKLLREFVSVPLTAGTR